MRAPSACRQETVASMSREVVLQPTVVTEGESAARISRRCATDLDEIAGMAPESSLGLTVACIWAPSR